MNGDGRPDLIAEGANGHIDVFPGNGDGTFQTTSAGGSGTLDGTTGNGGHLIATGDFNHDGLIDALTATPAGISTLLGNGTQYLGLKGIYNAGPGGATYAVADFNGDGNLDLALDSPEGIAIIFGNADGSFQTSQAFAAGQPAMSGALGVFTSSGNLDAVVSTSAIQAQFLRGNGDGTFSYLGSPNAPTPTTVETGVAGLWSSILAGDFNNDGHMDLAVTADGASSLGNGGVLLPLSGAFPAPPSGLNIQFGNGDGTFQSPLAVTGPLGSQQTANSPASFYGVSTFGYAEAPNEIFTRDASSYRQTNVLGTSVSSGLLGTQTTYTNHPHNLVFTGKSGGGSSYLFEQQEGDLFEYAPAIVSGAEPTYNLVGDLAVNGSLTTKGQMIAPDISPAFPGMSNALGFRAFPGSAVIADLDGDGNADVIVTYANLDANLQAPTLSAPNYVYIWFGSGGGKFLTSAKHPVNPVRLTPSRNFYQVAAADMNGDGIPDLILTDGYILSVQLGKGDGTFGSETHYLAGQGINTISIADINGDGKPDLVLANGGAVLSNPVANLEVLAANPDVNTGGVTVLLNQALSQVTGTVGATPEPSTYGSRFVIGVTLGQPATGTVTFSVDGVAVGSATLATASSSSVNTGAFTTYAAPNTLAVGTHTLTASYSGDATYAATTLSGTHAVVAALSQVTTNLTASPEPSQYSNPFSITASLTPPSGASAQPTGTVTFSIDGTSFGSQQVISNTATVNVPAYVYNTLAVGNHSLTATYSGDANYSPGNLSGSHAVSLIPTTLSLLLCVDPPGSNFPCGNPISTTPLISPITMYVGQSVDGAAIESEVDLTGTITFYRGSSVFCVLNANLQGGSNTCPTQSGFFPAGTSTVTVVYSGDSTHAPSTSNPVVVIVLPDTTTATLTSSLNPSAFGQPVTFTTNVQGNFEVGAGQVIFLDGTTALNTATLDSTGTATFTTSTLAVGTHPIHVAFPGSASFVTTNSPTVNQVVTSTALDGAERHHTHLQHRPIRARPGRYLHRNRHGSGPLRDHSHRHSQLPRRNDHYRERYDQHHDRHRDLYHRVAVSGLAPDHRSLRRFTRARKGPARCRRRIRLSRPARMCCSRFQHQEASG